MSSSYNNDEPSSGVVLLQARSKQIANKSLESTRRMINLTDESKDIGNKTIVSLNEQGEKLVFIDETSKTIKDDVKQAEKNILEMEKCCGIFPLPWSKCKSDKIDRVWKRNDKKVISSQPEPVITEKESSGFYVDRITDDAVEDEMQQNLSLVHSNVGDLRSMAFNLNSEVKNQNRQLDKIRQKVESNELHVKEAEKRTQKFAR